MGDNEYRSVVKPALQWLNSLPKCKAINIHGSVYMERGTPDIIGSFKGRMFLFECKADKGALRPDQVVRLRQWAETGAIALEVRSLDEVRKAIRELDKDVWEPTGD